MHLLKNLTVINYRSIKRESFPFSEFTGLIGYNNAGKTSILSACKWLLQKSTLKESDFNDPAAAIEVTGEIVGITEAMLAQVPNNHATALRPYIADEKLTIKRIQPAPASKAADIKLYVLNPAAEGEEDPWSPNPNGFDNAIAKIFPTPIVIGALENIEEDVGKFKATTTIGRLISEIMEPVETQFGEQARVALNELTKVLDADGENRAEQLKTFDRTATEKVQEMFPDVSLRMHVPTPDLSQIFKSGTIRVYEEGYEQGRDIQSLGSGAQRAIQMALIRQLAENKRGTGDSPTNTLLLIDEPELYLHPHAVEQTRVALKQLSGSGYQIIFATHSAQMVKSEDAMNAILVRKNKEKGTFRRQTIMDAVSSILEDGNHDSQLEMIFTLSNSTQVLFAETVILIEGATEYNLLPQIYEHLNDGETLGCNKCALVKQNGVENTAKSMSILKAMDLPVKVIADLDYAFRQAIVEDYITEASPHIQLCKSFFQDHSDAGRMDLDGKGLPTKKGTIKPKEAYHLLTSQPDTAAAVDAIHDALYEKDIWIWKRGVIESHLGIEGKKPRHWSALLAKVKRDGFDVSVDDNEEVTRLMNWLRGDEAAPAPGAAIPAAE